MKEFLTLPLRILTHNIRYATTSLFPGEAPWATRAPLLLNELRYTSRHAPSSFLCLQEVLHSQLGDILSGLNPAPALQQQAPGRAHEAAHGWQYIGVGRDDGRQAGEYAPILYRGDEWQLREWSTVWLSETPGVPSRGWDGASTRIVTLGVFGHRGTGRSVVGLCTHLDDQGAVAREKGAELILRTIWEVRQRYPEAPLWLAGDFNSEVGGEAYRVFAGNESEVYDLRERVPEQMRYGDNITFTGFGKEKPSRIDFIFLGKEPEWTVDGYAVLENKFDDGVYISDHRAVVGDVTFSGHSY